MLASGARRDHVDVEPHQRLGLVAHLQDPFAAEIGRRRRRLDAHIGLEGQVRRKGRAANGENSQERTKSVFHTAS